MGKKNRKRGGRRGGASNNESTQVVIFLKPIQSRARFSGRELMNTTMTATSAVGSFSLTTYYVDLQSNVIFNRLELMAQYWTNYRFHRLTFVFVPQQPTTTAGQVALSWNPDYSLSSPASIGALMDFDSAVLTQAFSPCKLVVPQKDLKKDLYVLQATDLRLSKVGTLFAASVFYSSSITPGEIYCEYDVSLWGAAS